MPTGQILPMALLHLACWASGRIYSRGRGVGECSTLPRLWEDGGKAQLKSPGWQGTPENWAQQTRHVKGRGATSCCPGQGGSLSATSALLQPGAVESGWIGSWRTAGAACRLLFLVPTPFPTLILMSPLARSRCQKKESVCHHGCPWPSLAGHAAIPHSSKWKEGRRGSGAPCIVNWVLWWRQCHRQGCSFSTCSHPMEDVVEWQEVGAGRGIHLLPLLSIGIHAAAACSWSSSGARPRTAMVAELKCDCI